MLLNRMVFTDWKIYVTVVGTYWQISNGKQHARDHRSRQTAEFHDTQAIGLHACLIQAIRLSHGALVPCGVEKSHDIKIVEHSPFICTTMKSWPVLTIVEVYVWIIFCQGKKTTSISEKCFRTAWNFRNGVIDAKICRDACGVGLNPQ